MTAPPAAPDAQAAVIDFLSRAESYDLQDGTVERIDTHCSIVFLVGDRAYKLKRAIRFSSLDYTTAASRQAACEAELVLNRRTAPAVYLGVRSINRDARGALAFDGAGATLDHVVVMRRFPASALFDAMIERGVLTRDHMSALGAAIADLHRAAERTPDFGGADAIRRVIANNDRELGRVAPALDGVSVGELSVRTRIALDGLAPLLERRRAAGKVRRGHGDLRLANICLWSGRPTLFDCIEFSEEIGCIDVLYDLAFLLMDLHSRDRDDLANAVFNAYLDHAPETDGLLVLPLFLALRAATRSYALAGKASRETDPRQAARVLASARRHIEAGLAFLAPRRPILVALSGDIEGGRAELAAALAGLVPPAPGARLAHLSEPGPVSVGRPRPDVSAVLRAGCSVLVEGAFASPAPAGELARLASACGVRFVGLWLGSPPAELNPRVWHAVDTAYGSQATLAGVVALVTAAGREPGPIASTAV